MQESGSTDANGVDIDAIVGSFHTFGVHGVTYEVMELEENEQQAVIRVVETGETLNYSLREIRQDPKVN